MTIFPFKFLCLNLFLQAAALKLIQERSACKNYVLPSEAQPSGQGKLWEYYHFLIDFAPAIYFHIRNNSASCKTLYVPGWHDDHKFSLTLSDQPQRTMQDKFDFFLGQPCGLNMELVDFDTIIARSQDTDVIDWDLHKQGEWADQPATYFTAFREHAWALTRTTPVMKDVIAIQRQRLTNYHGPETGYDRRHLSDEFYEHLVMDLASNNLSTSIMSLENFNAEEQVGNFANVKVIIGQHGAGLSNMIFAKPHTLVVEIGPRYFLCYETLAQKLGLHYIHFEHETYSKDIGKSVTDEIDLRTLVMEKANQGIKSLIHDYVSQASHIPCPIFFICSGPKFK